MESGPEGTGEFQERQDSDQFLAILYQQLRTIARKHMRGERAEHTLQPTALVHEAYLRMGGADSERFEGRTHFLRAASRAMRRVLVDHARARKAAKRDGGIRITLHEGLSGDDPSVDMIVLDDALTRLAVADPRWAQVVELRFFSGLEITEIAALLGVAPTTVKRDWRFARAWLTRELSAGTRVEGEHDAL